MKEMSEDLRILVIAGEASGDDHGADLMKAMKRKHSGIRFFGIGGDAMIRNGLEACYHVRDLSLVGITEIIRHFPLIRRMFRTLSFLIEEKKPHFVILIDYPGFNIRFAHEAKKRGVPVIYYISPQVWAWGKGRVRRIAKTVDLMAVFFPFEETLYQEAGVNVRFVGHPLKDQEGPALSRSEFFKECGLDPERNTIGILPGSRSQEIIRLLPAMLQAVGPLREAWPGVQAVIGKAQTVGDALYGPIARGFPDIPALRGRTREIMAYSDAVIVASGTATLETALAGTPMVIVYRTSPVTYAIGRMLVKVKHLGLANILAGKTVVPELIQKQVTPEKIAAEVRRYLEDGPYRESVRGELLKVAEKLGEKGAVERAADAVLTFMENRLHESLE